MGEYEEIRSTTTTTRTNKSNEDISKRKRGDLKTEEATDELDHNKRSNKFPKLTTTTTTTTSFSSANNGHNNNNNNKTMSEQGNHNK